MAYSTAEAKNLETVIKKVTAKNQRVALTLRGKPIAAVVPFEDLEYLERIEAEEDAEDIKACKAAEKESERPFSEVCKELGL